MKKPFFFVFALLLLTSSLRAQPNLDSLRRLAQLPGSGQLEAMAALATHHLESGSDSTLYWVGQLQPLAEATPGQAFLFRALFLRGLFAYQQVEYPEALAYFQRSLTLAERRGDSAQAAQALSNLGATTKAQGQYDQALTYFRRSLATREFLKDRPGIAQAANQVGLVYFHLGNFSSALAYYQRSLKGFEALDQPLEAVSVLDNIGEVFRSQENYAQSLAYYQQSLEKREQMGDSANLAHSLNNLGLVYLDQRQYPQAMAYFQRSLALSEAAQQPEVIASTLHHIGTVYFEQGDYAQAMPLFQRSLEMSQTIANPGIKLVSLQKVGGVYLAQEKYLQAKAYLERALPVAYQVQCIETIQNVSGLLYSIHKALGQPRQALERYELHIQMRDSLNSTANQRAAIRYEYQIQASRDSAQFATQQLQAETEYQQQITQRNYLIFGIVALALLSFVVFYFQQQRKRREAALAFQIERAERLEQIDQLKDQFLANTSHELRTPLNGIIGITEGLFAQEEDAEARENLGMVIASGKRLAALVNDLLDFSRIRHADLVLRQRATDLRSLADVILQVSYPLTRGKALQLQNEIPAELPAAFADEDRLSQVLYNVVGNAIKFTETGFVRLEAEEQGDQLIVSVSDTGIGISPERQEEIFQAFVQADGSTERAYGGTGLGLSISQYLIEQHGGKMWLESTLGQGSVFFFSLPKANANAQAAKPSQAQLTPLMPDGFNLGAAISAEPVQSMRKGLVNILIVDDEPINIQVLRNHLQAEPVNIHAAYHGAEALAMLEKAEHPFDLVLLDVMMPRMSGYEVARKIRETHLPSELPIIMVTAKNQVSDLVQGLETGANDYLAKPFSKQEFLARLKTHLNLQEINRATSRFIPEEFLHTLGKRGITDAKLGDHIDRKITVLFSDIRSYCSLSEQMTPDENFRFINQYFSRMGPVIQGNQGFVIQYLGDGIMALFQHEPGSALRASIQMQAALRVFNQERVAQGQPAIQLGIGFHTGPLVMGIIGDEERLTPAVIADSVNTAARLEGLTKHYRVQIILSEESYALVEPELMPHCRYLGLVQVKGRTTPLGIYECFAADEPAALAAKLASKERFEQGVDLFIRGKLDASYAIFSSLQGPEDATVDYFLTQITHYQTHSQSQAWSGVTKMQAK